jgi:hypothetical protein
VAFTRQAVDAVISFCMLKPLHLNAVIENPASVSDTPAPSSTEASSL